VCGLHVWKVWNLGWLVLMLIQDFGAKYIAEVAQRATRALVLLGDFVSVCIACV
jgi:hypothetical protein